MSLTPILPLPEVAHHLALLPLAWLWGLGDRRDLMWWGMASMFAVSWVADLAAHWVNPSIISASYPITQGAIIGALLLSRREAMLLVGVLMVAGLAASLADGFLLRTVAWGSVVGIAYQRTTGRLQVALVTGFSLMWAGWLGYLLHPDWGTWGIYQCARLLAVGLFCWASLSPKPAVA